MQLAAGQPQLTRDAEVPTQFYYMMPMTVEGVSIAIVILSEMSVFSLRAVSPAS